MPTFVGSLNLVNRTIHLPVTLISIQFQKNANLFDFFKSLHSNLKLKIENYGFFLRQNILLKLTTLKKHHNPFIRKETTEFLN